MFALHLHREMGWGVGGSRERERKEVRKEAHHCLHPNTTANPHERLSGLHSLALSGATLGEKRTGVERVPAASLSLSPRLPLSLLVSAPWACSGWRKCSTQPCWTTGFIYRSIFSSSPAQLFLTNMSSSQSNAVQWERRRGVSYPMEEREKS